MVKRNDAEWLKDGVRQDDCWKVILKGRRATEESLVRLLQQKECL